MKKLIWCNIARRHGIVFKDGSNGEKSILRGLCSEKDFCGALLDGPKLPGDGAIVTATFTPVAKPYRVHRHQLSS